MLAMKAKSASVTQVSRCVFMAARSCAVRFWAAANCAMEHTSAVLDEGWESRLAPNRGRRHSEQCTGGGIHGDALTVPS